MNTNEPCAAVFPVDEDFMRLPNNDVIQLEGRQQKNNILFDIGWLEYFKSQSYYKCY